MSCESDVKRCGPDLRCRSGESELMDAGAVSYEEFGHCLWELERINVLTLAYRPTLHWLRPFLNSGAELSILDVACGGGDMLRRIERRAASGRLDLIGVDLNPWSKRFARAATGSPRIRFATADIFHFEPERPIDLIISSLFTHHLNEDQIVDFLCWMHRRARRGWFINDLHRHPLPYHGIKLATALFSRNRLVRNDAALSVARAFVREDWQRMLRRAGLAEQAHVKRYFPFRLCVSCRKP